MYVRMAGPMSRYEGGEHPRLCCRALQGRSHGGSELLQNDLITRFDDREVPVGTLELADSIDARFEVIKKLIWIGCAQDGIFSKVQCSGSPGERDHTYRNVMERQKDVPNLFVYFLQTTCHKSISIEETKQLIIAIGARKCYCWNHRTSS